MPPKKRKAPSDSEKKANVEGRWLSRLRLRRQRENDSLPAAPPRNPAAASAAADLSSATRYDSVSSPANGSGAQLPIGPATVSTPVLIERRRRQQRHSARRRIGKDSDTPIATPVRRRQPSVIVSQSGALF